MRKIEQAIRQHPRVLTVDDERALDHGVIVMLKDGFEFVADPGCGTRGFDTFGEALKEVRNGVRAKGAA
jgi:hypothetical protein